MAIPSTQHGEVTTPQSATTPTKENKAGFVFGSPGKYEFSFAGVKAKSPRSRDISLCESEEGVVEEDEGDHLYFEVCKTDNLMNVMNVIVSSVMIQFYINALSSSVL